MCHPPFFPAQMMDMPMLPGQRPISSLHTLLVSGFLVLSCPCPSHPTGLPKGSRQAVPAGPK